MGTELLAAALAFLVAIILLILERHFDRRIRIRERRARAADRFIDLAGYHAGVADGSVMSSDWRARELTARFAAQTPGRDRYVADWGVLGLRQLIDKATGDIGSLDVETSVAEALNSQEPQEATAKRRGEAEAASNAAVDRTIVGLNGVVNTIILWAQGERSVRWFRTRVRRRSRRLDASRDRPGGMTG